MFPGEGMGTTRSTRWDGKAQLNLVSRSSLSLKREVWERQQQDRKPKSLVGTWSCHSECHTQQSGLDSVKIKLSSRFVRKRVFGFIFQKEQSGRNEWQLGVRRIGVRGGEKRERKDGASCTCLLGAETREPEPGSRKNDAGEVGAERKQGPHVFQNALLPKRPSLIPWYKLVLPSYPSLPIALRLPYLSP